MRSTAAAAAILALLVALPAVAHAERPDLAHGRLLVWGASGIVPILVTDVYRAEDHTPIRHTAPGGGVEARIGLEFDGGYRLEFAGGLDGHAVSDQLPLARYRFGAQFRMPIDLGGDVYPFWGVGAGFALFSRNNSIATTFDLRALAGVGWWLARWFALEFEVAGDITPPGFAFTDTIVMITPMIGVDLAY